MKYTLFVKFQAAPLLQNIENRKRKGKAHFKILKNARAQMLDAAGIQYFQDVLKLLPGVQWKRALYKYIDDSDVVFLFWSRAASKSRWVKKEILCALSLQKGNDAAPPDIIPIIIEGPPPVQPPPALNFLHFNDKFIYFIYAAEAEQEKQKSRTD